MKNIFIAACAIILWAGCRKQDIPNTSPHEFHMPWTDTSYKHPQNEIFKNLLEKYHRLGLPGISLLVRTSQGTWVGSIGKSDLERNMPFRVDQVSKIASISKLIIGTTVFRMMEDSANTHFGYSALNKKITTWLPASLTDKIANGNIATLGQLMNHESGIPDIIEQDKFYLEALNDPTKKWSGYDLVSNIFGKPALFAPGDTAIYSNTNIILITMIIESVMGRPHSDVIRDYVFRPLGMNNTWYFPHDRLPGNVAQGYYDLYNNNTLVNVSNIATGGMFSNIFDLYKFLDALILKRTLLTQTSFDLMCTWGTKADPPNIYGYGIMKKFIERGVNAGIGHSGRDLGYTANMFYFPNKNVSHIFLINYGSDGESKLRQVFKDFQNELLDLTLQ
jgi:D-alanyl-D-alanine carboxypeptidase